MYIDILGVFSAGILTFFTPCLLPLVPIYLSALSGGNLQETFDTKRKQLILRAVWFALGFMLVFILLGLGVSTLGSALYRYRPLIKILGGVLILLFGLKFIGFIHIPLFDRTVRAGNKSPQTSIGWLNALMMGVVFAAGWSPCAGPILGTVLGYTASSGADPLTGALYLAVYAVGVAVPLIAVAVFAQAGIRILNRIKPHLLKLEKALGLALVFVAGWLVFSAVSLEEPTERQRQIECLQIKDTQGNSKVLMLGFTSDNCHVCTRMKPVLDSIIQECQARKLDIKLINLSEQGNQHYKQVFNLVATPTFVFLDTKGSEVARLVGEQDVADLKQALSALIGEPCNQLGLLPSTPDSEIQPYFENPQPKPSCKLDGSDDENGTCGQPPSQ